MCLAIPVNQELVFVLASTSSFQAALGNMYLECRLRLDNLSHGMEVPI